jgi:hypothetical protein
MGGTFGVSNGGHRALNVDCCQNAVRNLLGVSNFVLSVEEVPDVQETVHSCQEEKTGANGGPATVSDV